MFVHSHCAEEKSSDFFPSNITPTSACLTSCALSSCGFLIRAVAPSCLLPFINRYVVSGPCEVHSLKGHVRYV